MEDESAKDTTTVFTSSRDLFRLFKHIEAPVKARFVIFASLNLVLLSVLLVEIQQNPEIDRWWRMSNLLAR